MPRLLYGAVLKNPSRTYTLTASCCHPFPHPVDCAANVHKEPIGTSMVGPVLKCLQRQLGDAEALEAGLGCLKYLAGGAEASRRLVCNSAAVGVVGAALKGVDAPKSLQEAALGLLLHMCATGAIASGGSGKGESVCCFPVDGTPVLALSYSQYALWGMVLLLLMLLCS